MKTIAQGFFVVVLATIIVASNALAAFRQDLNIEGNWEGTLDVGAAKLRLVLKVTKAADGSLTAKADSPDQGATDLPVDVVTFKDGALHFEMKRLMASYDGTASKEGSQEIAGTFKQGEIGRAHV